MDDKSTSSVHWSFWLIGAATLIWNAMGAMNFLMQMNPDAIASYPDSHRAIIEGRPAWATVGFAIAVFGGALGCLLLLLRKSIAYYVFIASLIGVVVTMAHTIGVIKSGVSFSPFEIVMMMVMPVVLAAFLTWYSKWCQGKAWTS